jgi:serine phosphatase RsbU (regulator of sigma subunit)
MESAEGINRMEIKPLPSEIRSRVLTILSVTVITMLFMFCYESTKEMLLPKMTRWESHTITIIFSSVIATICAVFIQRRYIRLSKNLVIENRNKELVEKELNIVLGELRHEKEELKKRNLKMENDLIIARKIQSQMLPVKSPKEYLAFCYKQMDMVGGDYINFMDFRDKNWVGILLCDVSGHGVQAALIISILKGTIHHIRAHKDDPAVFLQLLNEALFNQTGGNFVTAFYGIFNADSNEFIYANAGHNSPYLLDGDIFNEIPVHNRSFPLGIMDNPQLMEMNRTYSNNTIRLKTGSKLVLYTDGLTEAEPKNHGQDEFETAKLKEICRRYSGENASDFVLNLYMALVDFHGSDNFSDDVCIVCLDVKQVHRII